MRISYVISPHGFGHAARAVACMLALQQQNPTLRLQIITRVPESFFVGSGVRNIEYVSAKTDVGLVQRSPTEEDLPATIKAIDEFLRFDALPEVKAALLQFKPDRVIADISPLGLLAAQELKIPSVLMENFTWDWLYGGYLAVAPELKRVIPRYAELFALADTHIQVTPICKPATRARHIAPLSRPLRSNWQLPSEIDPAQPYVLVSMGGIISQQRPCYWERMLERKELQFVTGGARTERAGNIITFAPEDDRYYHPNLVQHAGIVVSKAGSGTVSEVYHSAVPFVVVDRPLFIESPLVIDWISKLNSTTRLTLDEFDRGDWVAALNPQPRTRAEQVASVARRQELASTLEQLVSYIVTT